jgi:hypothetical protein
LKYNITGFPSRWKKSSHREDCWNKILITKKGTAPSID